MQGKVQLNCTHKINMGGKIHQVCGIMILGFKYFFKTYNHRYHMVFTF